MLKRRRLIWLIKKQCLIHDLVVTDLIKKKGTNDSESARSNLGYCLKSCFNVIGI